MAPQTNIFGNFHKFSYPFVVDRQRNFVRFYWWKFLSVALISLLLVQYFFGASVYHVKVVNTNIQYLNMEKSNDPIVKELLPTNSSILKSYEVEQLVTNDTGEINNSTVDEIELNHLTTEKSRINLQHSVMLHQRPNLTLCPVLPPVLVGAIRVWFDYPSMEELAKLYPFLDPGGHGKPLTCSSRHRVAIVIPFRDRDRHLRGFLHNMHSLLTKQQLDYTIIVVEQIANQTFNRAKLMNVGFVEAMKLYDWQCFIFHDVDLYPEDDRNIYSCPQQPRHMSVAVDKFKYKLPYAELFGGISAIRTDQLRNMNGFSNDYWGWGGEDDDMATRVKVCGYRITRYPANIARYKMIKHLSNPVSNPVNKCRYNLMYRTKRRFKKDGISSVNYKVVIKDLNPVYTHFLVDLLENESKANLRREGICR